MLFHCYYQLFILPAAVNQQAISFDTCLLLTCSCANLVEMFPLLTTAVNNNHDDNNNDEDDDKYDDSNNNNKVKALVKFLSRWRLICQQVYGALSAVILDIAFREVCASQLGEFVCTRYNSVFSSLLRCAHLSICRDSNTLSVVNFCGMAYIHAVPYGFGSRCVLFKLVVVSREYLQNFGKQSHEISSFDWLTGDLNQHPRSE
jgi:hypothetical protein